MVLRAINDDFIDALLYKRDQEEQSIAACLASARKQAAENKEICTITLKIPNSDNTIERMDYTFQKPQKLTFWVSKLGAKYEVSKEDRYRLLKEAEQQLTNKLLKLNNAECIDEQPKHRHHDNLDRFYDTESEGEDINKGFEVYDFLKKKCEFCAKLGFNMQKQCKSCKLPLHLTSQCKSRGRAFNYCLKFLEQLLFFATFMDKKFIFNVTHKEIESLNQLSWFMDSYIDDLYSSEELKTKVRKFIRKFVHCFVECGEDDFVIEDEDRESFSTLLKEIQGYFNVEEDFENNFILKMKPKSKRGAHLIGIGRNIKYLKKQRESGKNNADLELREVSEAMEDKEGGRDDVSVEILDE